MLILIDDHDDNCITVRDATWFERLIAHARAAQLDRAIAAGGSPDADAVQALRARALVRPSLKHELADCVERLIREAERRGASGIANTKIPIQSDRILEAEHELELLASALRVDGPQSPCGVARVRVLLGDGAGPLYNPGSTEDLALVVMDAVRRLQMLDSW